MSSKAETGYVRYDKDSFRFWTASSFLIPFGQYLFKCAGDNSFTIHWNTNTVDAQ